MNKLKELLDGRELPINVYCSDPLLKDIYYTITHKNEHYALATGYYKENNIKITDSFLVLSSENWELYEEPKKKVKVALYAYKNYRLDPFWKISSYMYSNDKDAKPMLGAEIFKRLDWSETEVNDE